MFYVKHEIEIEMLRNKGVAFRSREAGSDGKIYFSDAAIFMQTCLTNITKSGLTMHAPSASIVLKPDFVNTCLNGCDVWLFDSVSDLQKSLSLQISNNCI